METRVLAVSEIPAYYGRAAAKPSCRPTIRLQGDWLNEIGFKSGKSVTAEYAPGRIILRPKEADNYRLLVKTAFKTGSGLFQVQRETNNGKEFPQLDIWGFRLPQFGFIPDSVVIARYEFGAINLSLVDTSQLEKYQGAVEMPTRILKVTHAKAKHGRRPSIKLNGDWLDEIGFTAGKVIAGEYAWGKIIIRLLDKNPQELENGALKRNSGLFQVRRETRNNRDYSHLSFTGFWLERFGFTIGKAFTACYEYGLIKLLLIDPERVQE